MPRRAGRHFLQIPGPTNVPDRELQSKLAPPMKSNEPDKEAFIKASTGVYEEFGKQVSGGAELIKTIQALR